VRVRVCVRACASVCGDRLSQVPTVSRALNDVVLGNKGDTIVLSLLKPDNSAWAPGTTLVLDDLVALQLKYTYPAAVGKCIVYTSLISSCIISRHTSICNIHSVFCVGSQPLSLLHHLSSVYQSSLSLSPVADPRGGGVQGVCPPLNCQA
jgi:hypothetical protein